MNFLEELRYKNTKRSEEWCDGSTPDPLFSVVEFCGEAGELADAVKKLYRARLGMVSSMNSEQAKEAVDEEVGDVMITLDLFCREYGIDIEQAVRRKFNKTSEKYNLSVFMEEEE